ncbi:MAG: hypothetical protein L3J29_09115 [Cyclobacteriaceae bacterium]|nr:hypothetical protein [Cyclobacteriaceae bacterium]
MSFAENSFDNMALIYAHFPADIKSNYHTELAKLLKVGGLVIFEAFSKNNPAQKEKYPDIGGPPEIDMLFSVEEIEKDFKGFEIIELKEVVIPLKPEFGIRNSCQKIK